MTNPASRHCVKHIVNGVKHSVDGVEHIVDGVKHGADCVKHSALNVKRTDDSEPEGESRLCPDFTKGRSQGFHIVHTGLIFEDNSK